MFLTTAHYHQDGGAMDHRVQVVMPFKYSAIMKQVTLGLYN